MQGGNHISVKIVESVAAKRGVDPTALEPPLHQVIDTDALESLFKSSSPNTDPQPRVTFTYLSYAVRVDAAGTVTVCEAPPEAK